MLLNLSPHVFHEHSTWLAPLHSEGLRSLKSFLQCSSPRSGLPNKFSSDAFHLDQRMDVKQVRRNTKGVSYALSIGRHRSLTCGQISDYYSVSFFCQQHVFGCLQPTIFFSYETERTIVVPATFIWYYLVHFSFKQMLFWLNPPILKWCSISQHLALDCTWKWRELESGNIPTVPVIYQIWYSSSLHHFSVWL